ncbi:MAG TPA: hypothetical protein VF392_01625 [Terracidiphilus sp.]
MRHFAHLRLWLRVGSVAVLLALSSLAFAQNKTPLPLKPGIPGMGSNHRLILKDGGYQLVRDYKIVGDRVRYLSQERGEWEELPASLVDWDATKKWEQDHAAQQPDDDSPAMKEAAELDREEAAARASERNRMPEVASGLELPDQDGVFALDTFHGTPELVELVPTDLSLNAKNRHGLSTLNPLAVSRANLELDGAHAKVHLHVNDPAIYLSLEGRDDAEEVISHALTVQTNGAKEMANRKHGAHSIASGFTLVKLDERQAVRIVGAIHTSLKGDISQSEDIVPTKVEPIADKHWLKLTPAKPLEIGEYALIEILSDSDINQSVWDFRVDPRFGDNPGALTPIVATKR